jgi:hypothetical protein
VCVPLPGSRTLAIAAVFIEKSERAYWTVVQWRSAMRATLAAAGIAIDWTKIFKNAAAKAPCRSGIGSAHA